MSLYCRSSLYIVLGADVIFKCEHCHLGGVGAMHPHPRTSLVSVANGVITRPIQANPLLSSNASVKEPEKCCNTCAGTVTGTCYLRCVACSQDSNSFDCVSRVSIFLDAAWGDEVKRTDTYASA